MSAELKDKLRFDEQSGRIWLGGHRMLLLHSSAFGAMRAELIQSLGFEHAQRLLLGMGCASGTADAAMVRELEGDMDPEAAFMSGPKLHTLEGIVRVEPLKLEIDRDRKHFYGEFKWINSYEAEEHIRTLGMHTEPVCWTQIGYACGFTSEFMETPSCSRRWNVWLKVAVAVAS